MQYIDPFDFLHLPDPYNVDDITLRKARSRMLAEFELSINGFLTWKGFSVDKTTALQLLESIEDTPTRLVYAEMREVPGLVDYLLGDKPQLLNALYYEGVRQDQNLRRLCSPMLAPIFNRQLGQAIEACQWTIALLVLKHMTLLIPEEYESGFSLALRNVQGRIIVLENAIAENWLPSDDFDPMPLCQAELIDILNHFPYTFQQLRNHYATALRKLAVAYEPLDTHLEIAHALVEAACDLQQDVSSITDNQFYKNRINAKLLLAKGIKLLSTPFPTAPKSKAEKSKNGNIVLGLVLLFILIIIVRASGGWFQSKKDPIYHYNLPEIPKFELRSIEEIQGLTTMATALSGSAEFYATLDRHYSSNNPESLPRAPRPTTGSVPYKKLFSAPPPSESGMEGEFNFRNDDEKDIVLLIEKGYPSEVVASKYVRAGAKLPITALPIGFYIFRVFRGNGWCDSIATYEDKIVAGFASDVDFLGSINRPMPNSSSVAPSLSIALFATNMEAKKVVFSHDSLSVLLK